MPHTKLRKIEIEDFTIRRPRNGRPIKVGNGKAQSISRNEKKRIEKLAIPPAWRDVRISADSRSHIQAVGRDEAGRRQYIYHRDWEIVRSRAKARRLCKLIGAMPRIRRAIARDLDRSGNRRVLATAARLVERLCLRAGHEEYAGEESGRGAATLLGKHVQVAGALVTFEFPGKSKKRIAAHMVDRKVARNIASFRKTAGSRLFRLETSNGHRAMTATDLNSYLARIAGCDISAKDFRTLRASTVALERLRRVPVKTPAEKKRILVAVCKEVAGILRNTAAVTRTSYIHSSIISAYQDEALTCREISLGGCNKSERRLLGFLRRENSTKQMSRPARR